MHSCQTLRQVNGLGLRTMFVAKNICGTQEARLNMGFTRQLMRLLDEGLICRICFWQNRLHHIYSLGRMAVILWLRYAYKKYAQTRKLNWFNKTTLHMLMRI
ncbi:hypothetical protein GOP47_0000799 [Adiantum capillus-veneris]|uniref:Uncharacterized protein n=1 Tax=Adiantum capillus-veneris TaxID=13818 RepID=A0A9D4VDN8_ADICA|nr:hypothetical protein GOP47_0000799 [Adiantum capillus-veneris]